MKNYYIYLVSNAGSQPKIQQFVLFVKSYSPKNAVETAQHWLNSNGYSHLEAMDASFAISKEFPEFTFVNRVTETAVQD